MSQYFKSSLVLIAAALLTAGCGSDGITAPDFDGDLTPLTPSALANGPFSDVLPDGPIATASDARNRALVIFPGATIVDVDLNDVERELIVAEVRLLPAGGGEVKLHFALANGRLAEAESEQPTFSYDFSPRGGFISLAEAIAAATGPAGKAGTVTEWKLQEEEGARWQYRIWVSAADGDWRIRVNARTGAVNRVQNR